MDKSILIWGLVIILGVPALTLILGEAIRFCERRGSLFTPVFRNLQRYVLPVVAVLVVMEKLLKLTTTELPFKVVETGFWLAAIVTLLSLLSAIITTGEVKSGFPQIQVPNLFFQAIRAVIVLGIAAYLLSKIWQINLGGIATALGVGSLVIALALQDTLSNLVSGFLLLFDSPFKVGDWIEFDGIKGWVVDQNWRSVTLSHRLLEKTVTVPNGVLAGAKIDNFGQYGVWMGVYVTFSYDDSPNRVLAELKTIAQGLDHEPNPNARISYPEVLPVIDSFGDAGINYSIWFKTVPDLGYPLVATTLISRIYYLAKRNNFKIPYPISVQYDVDVNAGIPSKIPSKVEDRHEEIVAFLRSLPYLSALNLAMVENLAKEGRVKCYGLNEWIITAGEPDEGFYILQEGRVKITVKDSQGEEKEVARVSRGGFFGEMALLGEASPVSAIALEDVEVIIIHGQLARRLIDTSVKFAQEMNQFIEERKRAISLAQGLENVSPQNANGNGARKVSSVLEQLRIKN